MFALRCCLKRACRMNSRWSSASAAVKSPVQDKPTGPSLNKSVGIEQLKSGSEVEDVVDRITRLNLLQVAELADLLKKRLNLPDTPTVDFGAAAALAAAGAAGAKADVSEEDEKPAQVSYTVKLVKFDEKQKVPLIKEIKNVMEGMNLVQAKKFVDSLPAIVKKDISKSEAEKLKETLSKVGAEIELSS